MWWPFKKKKAGEPPKTKAWPGRSVSAPQSDSSEEASFAVGGLTLGELGGAEGRESSALHEPSSHHHTADHASPVADQQAEAPESGSFNDHAASGASGYDSGGSYDSGSSDSGSSGGSDSSSGGNDS